MSDNKPYFHFTLGPVQGFVAQARRTRDFWAGSFLLSWLAGVAICAVEKQGGEIIFPIPNQNFLDAILGKNKEAKPQQGGIPNRFMADISNCQKFDGNAVTNAVKQAWLAIADKVWEKDRQGLEQQGYPTKEIWERQNNNFWDMSWVITEGRDTSALDKRKNFRTHTTSVEGGYKCMMMEGYQELSGASDKNSGKKRRNYWVNLVQLIHSKDIGETEELCAIAYIKRRFVHTFKDVKKPIEFNGNTLMIHGWQLPHNVPSVAYMASVPWLKNLLENQNYMDDFKQVLNHIDEMKYFSDVDINERAESKNHVKTIQQIINDTKIDLKEISLDGNIYYQTFWDNIGNFVADKQNYDGKIDDYRPKIKSALSKLYEKMDDFEPSPYYAILLMDGDSLGKQMSHEARQPIISKALDNFTQQAQEIVRNNDGFLIYAGGDDVLALLSLDDAIKTANQLRIAYADCFAQASNNETKVHSTLSGAINYCHIGMPLTQVLMDSHDLLDNIAKDGVGRNALAVRVWKPSGQAVQWAMPWEKVVDNQAVEKIVQNLNLDGIDKNSSVIEALSLAISKQKGVDKNLSIFSTGFFYKTRELMKMLDEMMQRNELSEKQASKLLLAEYLQSGNFRKIDEEKQKQLITIFEILIEQSKNYQSEIDDNGKASIDEKSGKQLTGDAGILVRILGQKGLGKGDKA
ncbi:type III-B CRISPR-associated protein Cas10/Cmr2 [Moraxella osloensis]|uniref:Type III-B CRISPR-associated protein Cas10/Cmr2 n=1 Tax=Faucicola osloensis TaxID=34062 RepID=A0AAD0EWW7_FAUOS|nr:type III-B CRISPR-associated protein Cas10/Cmr2 [Moraxella osloensis]ATQ82760.1 type III-B CRISPR-associated protein Cas10/Cmr2 [Moraxella osloensis]ATW85261.1 type III-B CRISPR-associated protein Cas10/Cmr2 [Moraxella osloensis]